MPGATSCPAPLAVCLGGAEVVGCGVVLSELEAFTTVTLVKVVRLGVLDGAAELELTIVVGAGEDGAAEDGVDS